MAPAEHSELSTPIGPTAERAATAYGAEALALVFEGFFPPVESNPLTGSP